MLTGSARLTINGDLMSMKFAEPLCRAGAAPFADRTTTGPGVAQHVSGELQHGRGYDNLPS